MTGGFTLWKDRGYAFERPLALTAEQRERYSRHLLIPEVGLEGQQKLLEAKVLLIGAGGLGSPAALYLAAAGVGTLGIVDNDEVDLTNLQRQVIHNTERIGEPKVESAKQTIEALNPDVKVIPHPIRLDRGQRARPDPRLRRDRRRRRQLPHALPAERRRRARAQAGRARVDPRLRRPAHDLHARTRGRATAACTRSRRPPSSRRRAARTACSACCPGIMGLLQANEVIKLVIGMGEPLVGRLLLFEALSTAVHAAEGAPRRRGLPDLRRRRRPREHRVRGLRGALRRRRLGFAPRMATVKIPPVLRPAVSGMSEVEVEGATVGEVLNGLAEQHPGHARPAVLRRRRAEPLRERLRQRRGRARPAGARDRRRRRRHGRDPARDGRRRASRCGNPAAATAARL